MWQIESDHHEKWGSLVGVDEIDGLFYHEVRIVFLSPEDLFIAEPQIMKPFRVKKIVAVVVNESAEMPKEILKPLL